MDIIINSQKISHSIPSILTKSQDNQRFVLFDIETTGLNPSYDKVILIGVLYQEEENIVIKQFFCNNSTEELELLKSFIDTFQSFNFYITYNGGNFDIPFLNKRFLKHNLNYRIDPYLNFDLYKVVRKNKNFLGLNNCKLKTVESFLGINRKDTIDGAESVRLYKNYEIARDENLKNKILLHNYEDILHLLPTLDILNFISKDRVFAYLPKEFFLDDKLRIRVVDYQVKKDFLEVCGNFYGNLAQDLIFYNQNYNFSLIKENSQFIFKVPLLNVNIEEMGTYSFINLNELDYIKYDLSQMNTQEKLKYLVKVDTKIKDLNIYSFVKDFSMHVLNSNM